MKRVGIEPDVLSPEEAGRRLHASPGMVLRWIREGLLDGPAPGTNQIPAASVEALADARRRAGRRSVELLAAADAGNPDAIAATARAREWARKRIAERGGTDTD